ncbi:hypothetical protein SAMN06265795_103191 [Noviherbaspirillum humi]|uniref:Uncharacterized protein n=1 Tax=Noviherbaspirillum humi TaxID=1688639 RepID=A0A239F5B6_9BURK|nr:hypothetical protein [Noviherbaspirillum humi]SNS52096.1 hypothetical protein SAMN06265795_103191 [Noviherbaspirillum humi]
MARQSEKTASNAIIKWSEEEWQAIAKRLIRMKGEDFARSRDLEEVKAKDIFLAQEVLPEERHRKLISISQGFQASRQRLGHIFEGLDGAGETEGEAKRGRKSGAREAAETEAADAAPVHRSRARHAEPAVEAAGEDDAGAVEQEPSAASVSATAPQAAAPANPPAAAVEPAASAASPRLPSSQDAVLPGAATLAEVARPFVAMFCQELASALVNALSQQQGGEALSSLLQAALSQAAGGAARPAPAQGRPQKEFRARQPGNFNTNSQPVNAAPVAPVQAAAAHVDDDHHAADNDVQPLFDPKLPPSPNSSFKPKIAIIGMDGRDFEDLRQQFPQFELSSVATDAMQNAPVLQECQRILGQREGVPVQADEFLRRTYGHRYLRVTGGMGRIRDQLSTWLDNPAAMNAAGRSWPKKKFNNNNNKGQGGEQKRRQNRFPKTPRQ